MINYSTYMQQNPFDSSKPAKAYAKAQMTKLVTFEALIQHVASHHGVFTGGTVRGVIMDLCACIVELLLDGKKVCLAELGDFWISLSSDGAEDMVKFTANNIKAVNIIFTPGENFENLVAKAEFNQVPSRIELAATLKSHKEGLDIVDLAAAREAAKSGSQNSGTDSGSSTGGQQTGGDTGGGNDGGNTGGNNQGGGGGTDDTGDGIE